MSESQGNSTGMGSGDATTKPAKGGPNRGLLIGGLVAIVVIAGVILTTNNSDAPRSGTASCATTSQGCEIGDIGPGGGKVFSLGGATAPATCSGSCLEVASATLAGGLEGLGLNWATAKSKVLAFGTSTAPPGTWRLPTQAELITLAAQPNSLTGLGIRTYWSSTANTTYDQQNLELVPGAYCRTISTVGNCPQTFANVYVRPIHAF